MKESRKERPIAARWILAAITFTGTLQPHDHWPHKVDRRNSSEPVFYPSRIEKINDNSYSFPLLPNNDMKANCLICDWYISKGRSQSLHLRSWGKVALAYPWDKATVGDAMWWVAPGLMSPGETPLAACRQVQGTDCLCHDRNGKDLSKAVESTGDLQKPPGQARAICSGFPCRSRGWAWWCSGVLLAGLSQPRILWRKLSHQKHTPCFTGYLSFFYHFLH